MSDKKEGEIKETQTSEVPGDVKGNNEPRLVDVDEPKSEGEKRAKENAKRGSTAGASANTVDENSHPNSDLKGK